MGHYRTKDLLLPPSLISFLRAPLAAFFPFVIDSPYLALAVVAIAGGSDVLDGFIARRFNQATPAGAVVDGVTDKLFAASVVATLFFAGRLDLVGVTLLGMRELGEAPLVLWWAVSRPRRKAKAEAPKANALGKAATVLQFVAVGAALLAHPSTWTLLYATGAFGLIAAISYWRRELASLAP
jgi:phosphatidylglycerophosphate synthase